MTDGCTYFSHIETLPQISDNGHSLDSEKANLLAGSSVPKKTPLKAVPSSWHLLSSSILLTWLGYIAGLIWLLEYAANRSHDTLEPSWWHARLPTYLLTGFAQAHGAITSMHLARLAVFTLHNSSPSVSSWAELFWIADRGYQGPIGLGSTLTDSFSLPGSRYTRFSSTFWLFALACGTAIPTPYLLQRAYAEGVFPVSINSTTRLDTFTPNVLPKMESLAQQVVGEGSWMAKWPVAALYNTSLVVKPDGSRDASRTELFFVGSLPSTRVVAHNMSILQVSAGCQMENPEQWSSWPTITDQHEWGTRCNETYSGNTSVVFHRFYMPQMEINTNVSFCLNYAAFDKRDWLADGTFNESMLAAFDTKNTGNEHKKGLVRCSSSVSVGRAIVNGSDGTFTDFTREPLRKGEHLTEFNPPILSAIFASELPAGFDISNQPTYGGAVSLSVPRKRNVLEKKRDDADNDYERNKQVFYQYLNRYRATLLMMGYEKVQEKDPDSEKLEKYQPPDADGFARSFQRGTLSMGVAIGILSKDLNRVPTNVTEYVSVSGRRRNITYLWAVGTLLTIWFALIAYLSIRMLRPTFTSSLSSYVAGCLLKGHPDLKSQDPLILGSLTSDPKLHERYRSVRLEHTLSKESSSLRTLVN